MRTNKFIVPAVTGLVIVLTLVLTIIVKPGTPFELTLLLVYVGVGIIGFGYSVFLKKLKMSFFSESVQQEVKEDSYPIMMINGAKVADVVEQELFESKQTLDQYLGSLKSKYKQQIRIPEDVLDI